MTISFSEQLETSITTFRNLQQQSAAIEQIALLIRDALFAGQSLFTCGNGGSAADALHLAEELLGRYRGNRRALPAICLAADSTALTCIANDFGYENIFARQIEGLARPGDILICFSTSGRSPNILAALQAARLRRTHTIALLGKEGGPAKGLADHEIIVAHSDSARIQEAHMQIVHYICEVIEQYSEARSQESE
ncbi:MAG: SIS domain-containing protein [Roseiflexaceae bacterium]|nr:SIS domain-containing protein [Roseiflexaceae bacterium]